MKMKKILALLTAGAVLTGMLAGCGDTRVRRRKLPGGRKCPGEQRRRRGKHRRRGQRRRSGRQRGSDTHHL